MSQERRHTSERWVSKREGKINYLKKWSDKREGNKKKREGNRYRRHSKNIEHMCNRNTWRRKANILIELTF